MADDIAKKQHYVPQVYLRNFANPREQVWVYDKEERRSFQANVRNVASENFFYDSAELEKVTGNRQFIEKHLGGIEGKYAEISRSLLQSLRNGSFKELKRRHRHFLSVYLVVQMFRTKESRIMGTHMAELFGKTQRFFYQSSGLEAPEISEIFDGKSPGEAAKIIQQENLLNARMIEEMSVILYRHIWVIQEAHRGDHFLSSDHPLSKRPHVDGGIRSMNGIASRGIEIMFPLSSRYLLTLCEREHFKNAEHLDGRAISLTCHDNMIYANQFQIYSSNRFVFSLRDDFSFVEMVLRESPIHGDPARRRIESDRSFSENGDGADFK